MSNGIFILSWPIVPDSSRVSEPTMDDPDAREKALTQLHTKVTGGKLTLGRVLVDPETEMGPPVGWSMGKPSKIVSPNVSRKCIFLMIPT